MNWTLKIFGDFMKNLLIAVLGLGLFYTSASYAKSSRHLASAELPSEIKTLINRMGFCHHLGGEEAYDEDRKKELNRLWEENACDSVDSDVKKAKAKYKKDKSVLKAIADELKLEETGG
jgi:hypothetical protein